MTPYQVRLVVRRRSADAPDVDPKPSRFEARWVESDGQMSKPFSFEPPLSDDDAADLRWYLEKYHEFVGAGTQARAANIEAKLDPWGRALYAAAFGTLEGKDVYRQALGVGQSALASTTSARNALARSSRIDDGLADVLGDSGIANRLDARRRQDVDTPAKQGFQILRQLDELQPGRAVEFRQDVDVARFAPLAPGP